ncbi:hypothetical protein SAMN02745126_02761 [Enhydrobacter aerosaccus]|uniref:Glutamine amidotransferase domain-containing protein n=1 Tax=Enhydrobacter aerosaccus TaxID=225324 RepID=A0A1T4PDP6_9HYPH|nr:hypothetical protein [Enhydrobacter aerosaccus]SJZ89664.1 hypothetical protein SAMN02745126_02761 [Enhydrobacter aerosaccus]
MNMSSAVSVAFDPLLSWTVLAVLGGIGLLLILMGLRAGARGTIWRLGAIAVVLAALTNPSLVEEKRKPIADVALVVVDDSDSMSIGERRQQVQAAREMLKRKFGQEQGLEIREAVLPPAHIQLGSERPGGTRLIEAMRSALVDVPPERLAGVVLLTDGQVHDVPPSLPPELGGAPLHALIAGKKNERDRLIVVEQSPRFGVVGRQVTAKFRVEDPSGGTAPVTISVGGEVVRHMDVPVGKSVELPITVTNPGPNIVELETSPGQSELTLDNNRALFTINGVRDRLRVLLVSGEPYQGERAWRNLLKSDPAVDLVHFTILRTPQKDDFTPVRELSLIVFPMRELFEQKLKEFDLIIFDRYESGNLITRDYFRNIAEYVKGGGALLVSVGPVFATQRSLYRTPLGAILPAAPSGDVVEQGFKPKITDIGRRHPVTADLPQAGAPGKEPDWGRWFRVVTSRAEHGNTVLSGADEQPLVVLDRVGQGRVAQIMSDQLWLWNRGIDGGGPQPELVRRVAHWLMKEPDLEEEALRATAVGGHIEITRRTLATSFPDVTMTAPGTPPSGGATSTLKLTQVEPGLGRAVVDVDKPGLYRFDDGTLHTVAAVGNPDPLEFSDVRATDEKLKPLVEASNGSLIWLADHSEPDIRSVRPGRAAGGSDWIGLRRNEGYTVAGINQTPLLPGIVVAIAFLMALGSAWWREGR